MSEIDETYVGNLNDEQKNRIDDIVELIENTEGFPFIIDNSIGNCIYYTYNGVLNNDDLVSTYFQGYICMDVDKSFLTFGLGGELNDIYDYIMVNDIYSDNALERIREAINKIVEVEKNNHVFIGSYKSDIDNVEDCTFEMKYSVYAHGNESLDFFDDPSIISRIGEAITNGTDITYSDALECIRVRNTKKLKDIVKDIKEKKITNIKHIYGDIGLDVEHKTLTYYMITFYTDGSRDVRTNNIQYNIDDSEDTDIDDSDGISMAEFYRIFEDEV